MFITPQPTNINSIQTFYVDPDLVAGSTEVMLTSIDLYFKRKPASNNSSGIADPYVYVSICEVRNNEPALNQVYKESKTGILASNITASTTELTATSFTLASPLRLESGRFYGIVIQYEANGFEIWANKQGDPLVGSNITSPGSTDSGVGKLFLGTSSGVFNPVLDTDIAFKVNVAKFTSNTATFTLVNKSFEFLTVSSRNGAFTGGEFVYSNVANSSGTIAVTEGNTVVIGTGTSFSSGALNGKYIVFVANSAVDSEGDTATPARQVLQVNNVVNTTYLVLNTIPSYTNSAAHYKVAPVGTVYNYNPIRNTVILVDSSANSTVYFQSTNTIIGEISGANAVISSIDNFSVDEFIPLVSLNSPSIANISFTYNLANNTSYIQSVDQVLNISESNRISEYDAYVISRSTEVSSGNLGSLNKSAQVDASFTINAPTTSLFSAPYVDTNDVDFMVTRNGIGNTSSPTVAGLDTEIAGSGPSQSRYISRKIGFANNKFAEDIRVFATAYRPSNTEVRVYAKIHNSQDPETFDDKQWTPLEIKSNDEVYSSSDDPTDMVEFEYGFQSYPESNSTISATFVSELANTIIVASANAEPLVSAGNLIKLYNPLIPDDYIVAVVQTVSSNNVTLNSAVSNNNLVGSGFKVDILKYSHTAFNNKTNDEIVRYYNSELVEFDTYDSMQIKIVLLSDRTYISPSVDQIQVIGVST